MNTLNTNGADQKRTSIDTIIQRKRARRRQARVRKRGRGKAKARKPTSATKARNPFSMKEVRERRAATRTAEGTEKNMEREKDMENDVCQR